MAVAVFSPAAVVLARRLTVGGGRERPHPADVGEPVVLDMPVRDRQGSPRGANDGSRSGVGLQRPGIGEPRTVVTDFSEHPCAGRVRQPGETDDDRIVRMGLEQLRSRPAQVLDAVAGGVERREQGARVLAHRGFDQNRLVQLRFPQLSFISAAVWSMPRLRPARRSAAAIRVTDSLAAAAGVGAIASTALGAGDPQRESAGEDHQEGWVELAQQRPQLVMMTGMRAPCTTAVLTEPSSIPAIRQGRGYRRRPVGSTRTGREDGGPADPKPPPLRR